MELYNKLPIDIQNIIDTTIWINYHKPIMDLVMKEVLDNPYCCPICRSKAVFKYIYADQIPPMTLNEVLEEKDLCWYCISEITGLFMYQDEEDLNNEITELGSIGSTISLGSIDELYDM
jgi:hypothetical protein